MELPRRRVRQVLVSEHLMFNNHEIDDLKTGLSQRGFQFLIFVVLSDLSLPKEQSQ
jgi:hypothetical protein